MAEQDVKHTTWQSVLGSIRDWIWSTFDPEPRRELEQNGRLIKHIDVELEKGGSDYLQSLLYASADTRELKHEVMRFNESSACLTLEMDKSAQMLFRKEKEKAAKDRESKEKQQRAVGSQAGGSSGSRASKAAARKSEESGFTGPLVGVLLFPMGMKSDQEATTIEILEAFGGERAISLDKATHVIVPDSAKDDRELLTKLQKRCGFLFESVFSRRPEVVTVAWLQEVVSEGHNAWDEDLLMRYSPLRAMRKPAIGSQKPVIKQAPPGNEPSATKRRRVEDNAAQGATSSSAAPCSSGKQQQLTGSLRETWEYLRQEHPDVLEAGELRCAIERSLMDCAMQVSNASADVEATRIQEEPPEDILGLKKGASPAEVRAAYRMKALAAHPDKGGDHQAFCRIQRAYRVLTGGIDSGTSEAGQLALPSTGPCKDFTLQNHRMLVKRKFEEDGVDLESSVASQNAVLKEVGLEVHDVGAVNRNEQGRDMYNQCFYLSLARSYLGDAGCHADTVLQTALQLKRVIEAAVLAAHPDWAGTRVGDDVQAFSDFLFFVLASNALLCELSVVVFDSVSGGVEIYRGCAFPGRSREEEQRANTLTIQYVPGHYRALVPSPCEQGAGRRPRLVDFERSFRQHGVRYVTTAVL